MHLSAFLLTQDFMVDSKAIIALWRRRKLSHSQTIEQLIASRCSGCRGIVEHVRYIEQEEKRLKWAQQRKEVCIMLQRTMKPFIQHDLVSKWKEQYVKEQYGVAKRFETLLLKGETRLGKTSFAENIFGEDATLTVQCQGLGTDLPSLRDFDRDVHRCIVFDEVSSEQVINNKALFQAGKNFLELAQSKCGGFRYSMWPYQVALICCSNAFPTTQDEGVSKEDENWFRHNLVVIELAADQTWFVPNAKSIQSCAASAGA